MLHINATRKGLITAIAMILVSLLAYYNKAQSSNIQYFVYIIYAIGILWTLLPFAKINTEEKKFSTYFSKGFQCFIVVTLIMVIFTFVFLKLHPEFKEQMAAMNKTELIKQGNYTPKEIDEMIVKSKEYYNVMLVSMSIFGNLIFGVIVTAITSLLLTRKK